MRSRLLVVTRTDYEDSRNTALRPVSGEHPVAKQEDRGQAESAADDDGWHQDHAVEFVVVENVTLEPPEQHARHPGPAEGVHQTAHRLGVALATDERARRESDYKRQCS